MAILTTILEVRDALQGFAGTARPDGSIDGGIARWALPPRAAYRVARLTTKLKARLQEAEELRRETLRAGGWQLNDKGDFELTPPKLEQGASEEAHAAALSSYRERVEEMNSQLKQILEQEIEIDYDPIPLSLFEHEKEDREARLRPTDIALALPFFDGEA